MKIKKASVARLVSISALGAGALGMTAGTAEASVIYTPLNGKVGFDTGYHDVFSIWMLPAGSMKVVDSSRGTTFAFHQTVQLSASGPLEFKPANAIFGQTWNIFGSAPRQFQVLGSRWGTTSSSGHSGANGTYYKLFEFTSSGQTDYGWLELNGSVSNVVGPDVQILGVAYDNTGAIIAAGNQTGPGPSVPEPSTMVLSGLAALALGAEGLRRWRAARKQAA